MRRSLALIALVALPWVLPSHDAVAAAETVIMRGDD